MHFEPQKNPYTFDDLLALMRFLRSPQGCPWDRAQDLHSLQPYLIEESYECLAAEASGDPVALCEELGDVLLQLVFQSLIAEEAGLFDLGQLTDELCRKLVRRHSHLFASDRAEDERQVKELWEQNKAKEKSVKNGAADALADVKLGRPPLAVAWALQAAAANHGFDWPEVLGPLAKLHEEADELAEAYRHSQEAPRETEAQLRADLENELGDLFFALVNLARKMDIPPETALARANAKFAGRFNAAVRLAAERGLDFSGLKLAEQDALWDEIKRREAPQAKLAHALCRTPVAVERERKEENETR